MDSMVLQLEKKEQITEEGEEQDVEDDIDLESEYGGASCSQKRPPPVAKVLVATARKKCGDLRSTVDDLCVSYGFRPDAERTRVYQVWPGKNVFCFGGRLICGPRPRGVILTAASIVISSWTFAVYGGGNAPTHPALIAAPSTALTIIVSARLTAVLANLFLVSSMDPGIIPRNGGDEGGESGSKTRKRATARVNGVEVKLKYCRVCKIFRPPRSCHCAVCDNCVERFDHHCPWTGQCIGLRNYRFYVAFVFSALALYAYMFGFCCWRVRWGGAGLSAMVRDSCETLVLLLFSFAAIGLLGGLSAFHVYLIAVNLTGYEKIRGRYDNSTNPFHSGVVSNMKETLFAPPLPSKIDFRAEITPGVNSG